ncbi:MAG: helix-turn-helix transcriptional regulator, partial [Clostridia bacterium]|nr:helix-turn-helix transcriptional regulator [Clostridia bacterium]
IISDEYFRFERFNADFLTIKNGVEYLHKYYYENFDINYLATLSNISEVYFRRLFKKTFGYPPAEYRIKLRINKACDYLKFTNLPVHIIAENLGFIDSAYFTKTFKERYKLTPLQYRSN